MISLADLKRRIDKGELSPDAALAQSVAAIEAQEKTIGAFVFRADKLRAQHVGPLRGIAVGIKDIIDTADMPTEMGAAIYKGYRPRADAPIVMMLKQAGATIAGKTTTTAFAANDPTATVNPHNIAHTPGGSSSGSAAAVAAGMLPLAVGTQTGGSVIRPASFCGVAAIKPSYRLLPTVGVKCFSWSLDTVGLFAAGVEDVAVRIVRHHQPAGAVGARVQAAEDRRRHAGFCRARGQGGERRAAHGRAAAAEKAGASVTELKLPAMLADAWRIHTIVQQYEAHQAFAWEYRENYDAMPPLLAQAARREPRYPGGRL